MRLLTVLISFLLAAGCASGPDIRADYDRSANFSGYRTYSFFDELGTDKAGYSSLLTSHFQSAVRREMDARGYRYVDTDPDLLVNFNANARDVSEVRSRNVPTSVGMGPYYGYRGGLYSPWPMYETEVDTIHYRQGTVNVDVVDADEDRLVWEGVAEGRLTDEAMQNPKAAVDRVISLIFERYPVPAPGAG
ncbi:MAG: DUF4136 domain-containing protein [Gammaproteobacteria bacterium]|jgi:hypothetical protein